jgi:hypothetical protein
VAKQLPQRVIAEALAAKCGGEPTNVRVSGFELSKKLPTDAELTVLSQVLGLSVVSLRALREASRDHVLAMNRMLYEEQVASGRKPVTFRLGPKHPEIRPLTVPTPKAPRPKALKAPKPKPRAVKLAAVPALADLVEQIDSIAPMPADRDARRRWFQCVSELSRIGAA